MSTHPNIGGYELRQHLVTVDRLTWLCHTYLTGRRYYDKEIGTCFYFGCRISWL